MLNPETVLSNKRFLLTMRNIELGMVPVRAIRVGYTGELGAWSATTPDSRCRTTCFDLLEKPAKKHGNEAGRPTARRNWLRHGQS